MLNMQFILQRLEMAQSKVTSEILTDLIADHMSVKTEQLRLYNAYRASGLPISQRTTKGTNKANNKLINDYRGEIVDQVVGYLFGNPVKYSLSNDAYPNQDDLAYKTHLQVLKDFKRLNRLDELDAETGKMMSVCGRAARLLYVDTKAQVRAMNVMPWECIFIYDQSLDQVQYALRYYNVYRMSAGKMETLTRVEWYDNENVYYYLSSAQGYIADYFAVTVNDAVQMVNQQPHQFSRIPLIDFKNNEELQGDFEKTESLIDGYDRVLSDAQNEIEDLRAAYLLFKGVTPDEKVLAAAKESGAFGCDKDDSISYLTKDVNAPFVENQKKSLRENIYRFSKTVDVNADTFTESGASGEARKWLLLALENRGSTKERKFKAGVQKMFDVVSDIWKKLSVTLDPAQIEIEMDRNLPVELLQEAQIQAALKGVISDRTRLKLFSPVKDVDEEMTQMEQENALRVNLDNVTLPGDQSQTTKQEDAQAVTDGTMTQQEYDAKWGAQ